MSSDYYDTHKDLIDQFAAIEEKIQNFYRNNLISNSKLNVRLLLHKDYKLMLYELHNYFTDKISKNPSNILMVLHTNLDAKCFTLLSERIQTILKHQIDNKKLGKDFQMKVQNIYSTLLEDLKNAFEFYRNFYSTLTNINVPKDLQDKFSKDFPLLISNILNYMGEVKRLKLSVNKKFFDFQDYINIEGDFKKDSNDAIKFYTFALGNNPQNYKVFQNIACVYREFLCDHANSIFWNIRSLAYIPMSPNKAEKQGEIKKIKETLEKEFEEVRKIQMKKQYNIHEDINNTTFLKYDIDYLPFLFYRVIGIFYRNIDVDKLEGYSESINIIIARYLINFQSILDNFKKDQFFEVIEEWVKMLMTCIFTLHYTVDNYGEGRTESIEQQILEDYPTKVDRISINKDRPSLLNFGIFNHNFSKKFQNDKGEIRMNVKESLNLIINMTKKIIANMNVENYSMVEKYLLILFYWLSINYDLFSLIIDEEAKGSLKYLNFYLRQHNDIAKFLMPQTKVTLNLITNKINKYILPMEMNVIGFLPINRFFDLNQKNSEFYRFQENKESSIMNKLILIHFLDSFGLYATDNKDIALRFAKKSKVNIDIKNVSAESDLDSITKSVENIKEKLQNPESANSQSAQSAQEGKYQFQISKKEKPLIVLDASNIAMRHGGEKFSTKGIQLVIDYFTRNSHKVISFLPDYLFKEKDGSSYLAKKRTLPDDPQYLLDLVSKGLVVQSPPQDYDDSYCIQYAKKYDAFIVTNDLFRDYIDKIKDKGKKETEKMWVKERSISYTFNKDEFLPNPDAAFFSNFEYEEYNH